MFRFEISKLVVEMIGEWFLRLKFNILQFWINEFQRRDDFIFVFDLNLYGKWLILMHWVSALRLDYWPNKFSCMMSTLKNICRRIWLYLINYLDNQLCKTWFDRTRTLKPILVLLCICWLGQKIFQTRFNGFCNN